MTREGGRKAEMVTYSPLKILFLDISVFRYYYEYRLLCHNNFHLKKMYCQDPSTLVGHTGNYFLLHMHVSLLLSGYYDPYKILFTIYQFVERKSFDARHSCCLIVLAKGQ